MENERKEMARDVREKRETEGEKRKERKDITDTRPEIRSVVTPWVEEAQAHC
jgi:hypothetical protein